jgi:hypothetical protein
MVTPENKIAPQNFDGKREDSNGPWGDFPDRSFSTPCQVAWSLKHHSISLPASRSKLKFRCCPDLGRNAGFQPAPEAPRWRRYAQTSVVSQKIIKEVSPQSGRHSLAHGDRSCEKIGCHAERSEASAFIPLKTKKCRFLATLGMTGPVDFFTPSQPWVVSAAPSPPLPPPRPGGGGGIKGGRGHLSQGFPP